MMMMRKQAIIKLATIAVLILALIGVLTWTIVDFTQHQRIIAEKAGPPPDPGDLSMDPPPENVTAYRIMFLGASITRGETSTGDRGYRKHIRDTVISQGKAVNSVGFNRFGDWDDNDVEGWGAFRIRTITKHARQSVPALHPNLVLIQVGTSDCFQNDNTSFIGPRMRTLVNVIMKGSPLATVILSTLPTTPDPEVEPCIMSANDQIRQVYEDLIGENKTVALAEMHYDQGLPDRPEPKDIGPDRIHPTDDGYIMMGNIFLEKIKEVEDRGILRIAANSTLPDDGDLGRDIEDAIREKTEKENPIPPP
ncbi:SGNH hydrolase-type esterase domain-containing protein [Astrocystis sublimbata]|nr:SGNH hydrolase-type esterase domain-containing protein [Astrocystis sublimbata]